MDPIESSDSPPCPLAPILEHLEALVRPVWNGGMAVEWSPEEIAEVGANLDLVWSQLKKIPLPAKC
ncbi:hypothetical protein C1280_13270 [Gemmata obscuriglobus]|uniref:Uncharacterized protein n=2 Tax=Gemmata obscuriglobus TaxID=114 RepID=A0A2Z3H0M1_9BACT|nr:hypothetical protein C1280_13270 [Gemmata obscuriglobus]